MKISEFTPQEKATVSHNASAEVERGLANFIACFSISDWWNIVASYLTLEGLPQECRDNYNVKTIADATYDGVLTLIRRGAFAKIQKVYPIPVIALGEVLAIAKRRGVPTAEIVEAARAQGADFSEAANEVEPQDDAEAVDACLVDLQRLSLQAWNAKWDSPEKRAIAERAIARAVESCVEDFRRLPMSEWQQIWLKNPAMHAIAERAHAQLDPVPANPEAVKKSQASALRQAEWGPNDGGLSDIPGVRS